jgi:hypothetical protein
MKKLICMFFSVLFSSLVILQGCSTIILSMAFSSDEKKKNYADNLTELLLLEKDKPYKLTLKTGEKDSGIFMGFKKFSEDEYRLRYSISRIELQDSLLLPDLGDVLTISKDEKSKDVRFKGFDANYVLIEVENQKGPRQLSYPYLRSSLIHDSHNNIIELSQIEKFIRQRKIALLSATSFETKNGIRRIPLDEISRADFKEDKNDFPVVLLYGATLDALLVYSFIKWQKDFLNMKR